GRIGVRGGLEVHALDGVAALGDERESAFGAGVDEHLVAGRGLAEDAEPGERVLVEVPLPGGLGDHRPAGSAGAVGADDVSGPDAKLLAVDGGGGHPGAFAFDI